MIFLKNELLPDGIPSYKILQISEHQIDINFLVPSKLTYFHGHFPDFPVLPAVALMDITSFLTQMAFALPFRHLEKINQLKIFSRVAPLQQVKIQLTVDPSVLIFKARWLSDDEKTKIADITFSYSP